MLAKSFEQVGGGDARGLLNFHVAIDERQAEPPRQAPTDGRFTRAHQADEDDWSIKEIRQLLHFDIFSLWPGLYIVAKGRAKAFLPHPMQSGATMPRGLIFLVVLILALAGGIFLLSRSADEVPVKTMESDVTSNAAAN
jgi:hypothetical protein